MTDVDALTAFCRARLDEEEFDARAATPGPWVAIASGVAVFRTIAIVVDGRDVDGSPASWPHIARQDPAATLARVAALRALVEVTGDFYRGGGDEILLEHIAAIWRDHPDYREEWKA